MDLDDEFISDSEVSSAHLLDRVEHLVLDMIQHPDSLCIRLRNRFEKKPSSKPKSITVAFPGANHSSARRFAALMRILDIISENLTFSKTVTKRDIYYRDVALFKAQSEVDRFVDDIAATLSVPRRALGVVASRKGVMAGFFVVKDREGKVVRVGAGSEVALVPEIEAADERIGLDGVDYVLVVEKEAVFQTLVSAGFCSRPDVGRALLITGKGYPDISTRGLVHLISETYPEIPLLGIVDSDPYGIHILGIYKYGSKAMVHEASTLIAGRLQWIGVRLLDYEYESAYAGLSKRDRRMAMNMLGNEWMDCEGAKEMRAEVQRMLFLGRKAEMNVVGDESGLGISEYLARLIRSSLLLC
ncbi:Spo11/DNA topoisomerase VI subunit A [Myxozyma melibiosi]|uniref:DNA topoisomerase (ATP-hydrolyzing) n=1 Tax=Myxozyma melibiosi TaxID=54550 RepID=A0ABR1FB07_9ASCO